MADIKIINVGGDRIGINGLDQVLADMEEDFALRDDAQVGREMVKRLGEINYLAPTAEKEYAQAFVREFRRRLGQDAPEEEPGDLRVRVLGPGCPRCEQLYQRIARVLSQMKLAADLQTVKDPGEISAAGVVLTPGLLINERVVSCGKVPTEAKIRQWLEDAR